MSDPPPTSDPIDPQLSGGHAEDGCEPALPGEAEAFDPVWRAVAAAVEGDDDPRLWFEAVRRLLLPILRENRLGTREEPVRLQIVRLAPDPRSAEPHRMHHWYFDLGATAGREVQAVSPAQRLAVGTQSGALVELEIPGGSANRSSADLLLQCKRYSQPPGAITRHPARRLTDGSWEIGPGRPEFPCE